MIIMKMLTKVTKVSLQAGPEGRIGSSGSGGRCISSYLSLFFFLNIIINYLLIFIIVIIISSIYREADASPHICSLYFFLNIIIHKYLLIHYRCYHFYYLSGGRCISSYLQLLFLYLSKSNCSFFSFELLCGQKKSPRVTST